MKKLLILFLLVLGTTFAFAQQSDLKTKTFRLDNGLKVVMCEDHSQPEIYGRYIISLPVFSGLKAQEAIGHTRLILLVPFIQR